MAAIRATLPRGTPIELWWQDEARVGQKNGITRRWARRGTRPSAPKDQRTASAYIYGAICPAEGKGAALVLPRCNTRGMNLHLAEISVAVAPGAHAILLLDQAGWHDSGALIVPANITLLLLPSKCPELNPVENIWQFMRQNWLSNRIFKSYADILDQCAASCELSHAAGSSASAPACHHETSTTVRIGQSPTSCGHDHSGSVGTLAAASAPTTRAMVAALGMPAESIAAADVLAVRTDIRSTSSPPISPSSTRALPLRI